MLPFSLLIPFVILVEGFTSIAIEILVIRQLLPVAGGSVVVTSLIIGVFLLFLALGYSKGGRLQTHLQQTLQRNFFIVAVWMGVGLSYAFVIFFFSVFENKIGPHVIYPLLCYLIFMLAPPIYWLGQTLPITMNLVKQDRMAGVIAGKAMGLSTLGSFLGAVFTTLVLMYYFGVAWTVFLVYALLMLLSLLMCESRRSLAATIVVAILASVSVWLLNVGAENRLFVLSDRYANYQILDASNSRLKLGQKILVINDVYSSYIDNKNGAYAYVEMIRKRLFGELLLHDEEILVLGAGGFSLSQGDIHRNHFTFVDIDKNIKRVVVPRFVARINDVLVIDDARHYLNATKNKFKVIIVDVYSDYKAIPSHLITQEFMVSVRSHLKQDGYAIVNIIANPTFQDPYSKRIDNTIRSAFGSCVVTPISYQNRSTNVVYTCARDQQPQDQLVYVDNFNNSTTDSFAW